jgi:predicted dehydrogenase
MKTCAFSSAAAGLPAWFLQREAAQAAPARKRPGPNNRPAVALVGCGGMGTGDATNALHFADIVAVCDVDESHLTAVAEKFKRDGKAPLQFRDFRKVMERDDIDAVIQATPDHWHTLVNLAAARAGKDVYGEKPLTLTIDEGRRLVNAIRKYKIVFQTGSQQRSDRRFRLACELVRNGRIGKLKEITVYLPAGLRGGPFASSPVPQGLNWDFWLGQAPKVDYVKERCHLTFRYWLDYSGGTMTDWGAHHNDIARWAIGLEAPVEIESEVLAEPVPGGYTAFSEYVVTFTYANGVRHVVRSTPDDNIYGGVAKQNGQRNGVRFTGSEGWIWVNRSNLEASKEEIISTPLQESAARLEVSRDHMGNFFDCLRSRGDPICHVEVGHRSASLCHLGTIALRLRRKLRWDGSREVFVGDGESEANQLVARPMRKPYDYDFVS